MKKKPARKGRFFHALNAPRALCRTQRKRALGQDHGELSPYKRRERGRSGKITGDFSLPDAAKESCLARSRGAFSVRRRLGVALLRGKIAGAGRVFLRRGFCPGTPLLFKPQQQVSCARERPCSVPGWGKARRKERAGRALFSAGAPLLFKPPHPRQPCAEQTAKYFKKPQKGRKKS